jgi:hypothetical protein
MSQGKTFWDKLQRLASDRGYGTIGDLIDVIVQEREALDEESTLQAAKDMDWEMAWSNIVGPALDQLTDYLIDNGAREQLLS